MNTEGNALLGFLDQREKWANNGFMSLDETTGQWRAWWQHEDFKGGYPGPIPMEDLRRRMLHWVTQECDIAVRMEVFEGDYDDDVVDPETGVTHYYRWVPDPTRKAIVRPDNQAVFGYVGRDTYGLHQYTGFMQVCENIADGELGLASAFLMDQGGVFVVNMELPDDITTEAGIDHRIRLMGFTSQNQRFNDTWKVVDEFAVCSNSFNLNLRGKGNEFSVKHTSRNMARIADARQALGLVYKAAEEYNALLDALTKVDVTDDQFHAIIRHAFPMPEAKVVDSKITNQSAITRMENRHAELAEHLKFTTACPWAGTLFGAFQAWSTWNQHDRPKGDALAASIMGTIDGRIAQQDAAFFQIVAQLEDVDLRPLAELAAASK